MNILKKQNSDIAILSVLFEIVVFSLIFLSIGFLYNRTDPLLISSKINFLLILILTITLFYGLYVGLIFIVIFTTVMYIYYKPFPFQSFAENLITTLICGEFHFYYRRTIRKLNEERNYLLSKFNQLRNSFYLLKLSHDQLEKSFLLKPVSLRSILLDIRDMSIWDEEEAIAKLSNLIAKNFGVKSGGFFLIDGDKYIPKAFIGDPFEINRFNVMLNKALEDKDSVFLSEEFENIKNYEYIAVIPALNCEDTIVAVFIIKDIQFLSYNRENMLTISIIMSIYADYITQNKILQQLNLATELLIFEPEFNYEILRLYHLKNRFKIDSTYVIFKYDKELNISKEEFFLFIKDNIRAVDLSTNLQQAIVVLLPMISYYGAKSFQLRINNLLQQKLKIDTNIIEERIIPFSDYDKDISVIRDYA